MKKWKSVLALFVALASQDMHAAVSLPYSFTAGQSIRAAEVNANDQALRDGINNHESSVNGHNTTLESILSVNNSCGAETINFNLSQGVNFRAENIAADPTCGPSSLGRMIWNTGDDLFKICDGSSYVSIAGSGVNTLASVLTAGNTAGTDINMDAHQLISARAENKASDYSQGSAGRFWLNTVTHALMLDNGSAVTAIGGSQGLESVLTVSNSAGTKNINFNQNQALSMVLERLATAPGGGTAGQVYYDTVALKPYFYNGSGWSLIGNTNGLADTLAISNSVGSNDVNFNLRQAISMRLDNLASSPGTGSAGRTWFNTTSKLIEYTTGTASKTVLDTDTVQTVTNKSLSGSSNTFTNIPDGALSANVDLLDTAQSYSAKKTFSVAPQIAYIKADGSATNGHLIPGGLADDTFVLKNAVQELEGKVLKAPTLSGNLDFSGYQAVNMRVQNASANPDASTGRIYFNSSTGEIRYYDGTNWRTLTSSSGSSLPTLAQVLGSGNTAGATNIDLNNNLLLNAGTPSRAAIFNGSGTLASSGTTSTELGYVSGVTSAIQTQIDSKQATGSYITDLTGDVTASGPGSVAATVASVGGSTASNVNAATVLANAATSSNTNSAIVRRDGSGNFSATQVTATTFVGALTGNVTGNASGTAATFTGSLTGDVTSTAMATTIASNAVTNAKAAQMAAHTFKGNNTGSTANAIDLTVTQATAELNAMVGDSGSGGTKGLVPAPASGDFAAAKFLTAGGTWAVPAAVVNQPDDQNNLGIAAAISSNTLIVSLKQSDGSTDPAAGTGAVKASFRSATATTGGYASVSFTAANTVTLAAADSIGVISGTPASLYVYLVSDTTSEICLSSVQFDDTRVQSASAITGGADTGAVLWCTNAHTSKPIKQIGRVTVTWSNPNWGTLANIDQAKQGAKASPRCQIVVDTGNGHGSTDTKIRRYTNATLTGTCLSRSSAAGTGDIFTVLEDGVYAATITDRYSGASSSTEFGISLNSAGLTTNIGSLSLANGRIVYSSFPSQFFGSVSTTFPAKFGDLIRVQTDGAPDNVGAFSGVRIVQVSK